MICTCLILSGDPIKEVDKDDDDDEDDDDDDEEIKDGYGSMQLQ